MIAVFPGSFCPPTSGHFDVIVRAATLFDKLYVVVGVNPEKEYEISDILRKELLEAMTKHIDNVEVVAYDGFMTDFCAHVGATVLVKAARNAVDMQYIIDIERVTRDDWSGETVVLIADKRYENVSSTLIRDLVKHNKSIDGLVPDAIKQKVVELLK
jgi:pantetheine-phosphate adenylyltransferase